VIVVEAPLHSSWTAAAVVPPTVVGSTFTVTAAELAVVHTPLCTTVRNWVVAASGPVLNVVAVELTSVQVVPSNDDCHLFTVPV
jgi:hypothetical protein